MNRSAFYLGEFDQPSRPPRVQNGKKSDVMLVVFGLDLPRFYFAFMHSAQVAYSLIVPTLPDFGITGSWRW